MTSMLDPEPPHPLQRRLGNSADQRFSRLRPHGTPDFDPISLICKVSEAEGRPAVNL